MNDLRLLYQLDKDKKIISLEYKQITSIEPLLPILTKFKNLESLSLYGNRLKSLPTLEMLDSLVEIDLSNNLFEDTRQVIGGLKTLPKLRHLIYTFKNDDEENELKNQLPQLERINKQPCNNRAFAKKDKKKSQLRLEEKDLEQIGQIYDQIRDLYRNSKFNVDKNLMADFDKSVDLIMTDLSIQLSEAKSQTEIDSSIITCRYGLIDMCFTKIITFFYHSDKNVAMILEKIHDYMAQSFKTIGQIMKVQEGKAILQMNRVKTKKEQLYKQQIKRLKEKDESSVKELDFLEKKNNQLLRILAEHTKNTSDNYIKKTLANNYKITPLSQHKPTNSNIMNNKHSRVTQSNHKKTSSSPLSPNKTHSEYRQKETEYNLKKMCKNLSVNQLKQTITEIYQAKNRQDRICLESGIAMETMQEFMYTFLNQKYGLKSLTIQWAMGIVNGIKKHGSREPQIAIFGKVLRNQIQENYHQNLVKVKSMLKKQIIKFKGSLDQKFSINQAEQILLNSHYQRDKIALITPKLKNEMQQEGKISADRLESAVAEHLISQYQQETSYYVKIFKEIDKKGEGWITRDQLLKMVQKTGKQVDQELLLEHVDPFMTDKLTFTWVYQSLAKDQAYKQLLLEA